MARTATLGLLPMLQKNSVGLQQLNMCCSHCFCHSLIFRPYKLLSTFPVHYGSNHKYVQVGYKNIQTWPGCVIYVQLSMLNWRVGKGGGEELVKTKDI